VGRRDDEYPGWIWTIVADGNAGWAPESLLEIDGETALTKSDYTARELNTQVGDALDVVRELTGWLWVRNERDEEGWIPAATVSRPDGA
jgi:SH3-like domain-containing protein